MGAHQPDVQEHIDDKPDESQEDKSLSHLRPRSKHLKQGARKRADLSISSYFRIDRDTEQTSSWQLVSHHFDHEVLR
jgi:hypothetical protein